MKRGPSWGFWERDRWLLIGLSFVLAFALMWWGFKTSSTREYIGALLAALGANALVVGVGLILLDHFQRAKRRQEWERITQSVLREAKQHLLNVGLDAATTFDLWKGQAAATLLPKYSAPDTVPEGLMMLAEEIDAKVRSIHGSGDDEKDFLRRGWTFLEGNQKRCEAVAELLRTLGQAEVKGELIASFVDFGQAFRSFSIHVEGFRRKGLLVIADLYVPSIGELLKAAADLYGAILSATTPAGEVALFKP